MNMITDMATATAIISSVARTGATAFLLLEPFRDILDRLRNARFFLCSPIRNRISDA